MADLRAWLIKTGYYKKPYPTDDTGLSARFVPGKDCPDCGELISPKSKHCRRCAQKGNQYALKSGKWVGGGTCEDCGIPTSPGRARCRSCAMLGNQNARRTEVAMSIKERAKELAEQVWKPDLSQRTVEKIAEGHLRQQDGTARREEHEFLHGVLDSELNNNPWASASFDRVMKKLEERARGLDG